MSAIANEARIITRNTTVMTVPTADLDMRRKAANMGARYSLDEKGSAALGMRVPRFNALAWVTRVARRRLGLFSKGAEMGRRKLVAGNWKMHGLAADLDEV